MAIAAPAAATTLEPASGTIDLANSAGFGASIDVGAQSAALLGDVNGDGSDDIALGVPTADPDGRQDAGSVFVLFGGRGDPGTVDAMQLGDRGFRIDGGHARARLGSSIASLGNADGDGEGLADFAIGAPGVSITNRGRAGAVYLVYGSKTRDDTNLRATPDKGIVALLGLVNGDRTGTALAALPPVSPGVGAGLVIGVPGADPAARANAGSVYVLTGPLPAQRTSLNRAAVVATSYRIDGPVAGGQAGAAVGTTADISGDDLPDVLVGAPTTTPDGAGAYAGAAYVVAPRPLGATLDLAQPTGEGMTILGSPGTGLGAALAGIGDLNGDRVPDIAVGAPSASPEGRARAGSVFVVFGRSSTPLPVVLPDPTSAIEIDGSVRFDRLGRSLAVADLDGDPYADLLVAAPQADPLGRANAGAIYALRGDSIRSGPIDLALMGRSGVRLAGAQARSLSGTALAAGADAIGEPRSDVVVGGSTTTAILDLPKVPSIAPTTPLPAIASCVPATDVELVVDDSGSMRSSDPQLLRRTAVEALLSKLRAAPITLGAVEIGARAEQIFPSLRVGAEGLIDERELATLRGLLDERIRNNGGATDYAGGLVAATLARPQANALVLITDAQEPASTEALPVLGPRVYVLQLSSSDSARSALRLRELAQSSGGEYFNGIDAGSLPAALALVEAGLNCEDPMATRVGSTATGAPTAAEAPPTTTPTDASQLIAASTVSQGKPVTSFDTGLGPQTKTATMTLNFDKRTRRAGGRARRGRGCVNASPVRLRSLRVYAGRGLASRATERQLRRALSGRPTKIGRLRAWGRCGPGYLTLRLTGLERIPGVRPGARAAIAPTRTLRTIAQLRRGRGRQRVSVAWVSSARAEKNRRRRGGRGR